MKRKKKKFPFCLPYHSFTLHFLPKFFIFFSLSHLAFSLPFSLSKTHTRGEQTSELPLMNYFPLSSAAALKFPRFSVLLRILWPVKGSSRRWDWFSFNNFLLMTFLPFLAFGFSVFLFTFFQNARRLVSFIL